VAETPDESTPGLPKDFKWGQVPPGFEEAFDGDMSTMRTESVPLHEIYLSHCGAGFTTSQAIYLLAAMVTSSPGNPPTAPEPDGKD